MKNKIEQIIEEIFGLYEKHGAEDYIGEPVSQLEHMSQAAAFAMQEGFDDEVVLAAFFHDIGHICIKGNETNTMDGYGIKSHEKIGADFLREKGFPEKVAALVENHVQAKRYLSHKDPTYYNSLSEASKKTLTHQGGMMTHTEAAAFEKDLLFEASIQMRKWDELAKETGIPVLNIDALKIRAYKVLANLLINPHPAPDPILYQGQGGGHSILPQV